MNGRKITNQNHLHFITPTMGTSINPIQDVNKTPSSRLVFHALNEIYLISEVNRGTQ